MYESKYSKLLTGLLITGIISVVVILGVAGFFIIRNGQIDKDAKGFVDDFTGQVQVNELTLDEQDTTITNQISPIIGIENILVGDNSSNSKQTYKGFPMVGTIEIPAINLKYPVLEESNRDEMEVAVGVYYGPGLNKVGVTTIAGHNYRDGRFFANNKKLVDGDKVYITDTTGQKITYIIYKIYTTSPEDDSHLDYDTQGKREIALSTCTDDTKGRLIILAKEQ